MWVLGIARSHNGAIALSHNGKVVSAIQAERLSGNKRQTIKLLKEDKVLVSECVEYCLNQAGIVRAEIDCIAVCTPWSVQKLENEKLFNYIGGTPDDYKGTVYVPHHLAHMEYILHYSHFDPGIVLVVDGSGSQETDRKHFNVHEEVNPKCTSHISIVGKETVSAYWFDGHHTSLIYRFSPQISRLGKWNPSNSGLRQSIGEYWEWASIYCCGSKSEAGKVMGLAAFGEPTAHEKLNILSFHKDGKITLDYEKLNEEFVTPNVFEKDLSNKKHYADIAAMVQKDTENFLLEILSVLKEQYPTDTLYYAGGVALNVVANEKIIRSGLFKKVILNGSAEDNGTAIGAALTASNILMGKRVSEYVTDYYGRDYSDKEIMLAIKKFSLPYKFIEEDELYDKIASLLFDENVVAWFQGRSEFGPRALGNRSILANPSSPTMKYILDLQMKHRDRYRPYAPAVLQECVSQYFDIGGESPVMMREAKVLSGDFPAITHVDGSARVQTVTKENNERFYKLIQSFKKVSGFPVILNTSFNLPGKPIVETPFDALNVFKGSAIEYLCIGNYLLSRKD